MSQLNNAANPFADCTPERIRELASNCAVLDGVSSAVELLRDATGVQLNGDQLERAKSIAKGIAGPDDHSLLLLVRAWKKESDLTEFADAVRRLNISDKQF